MTRRSKLVWWGMGIGLVIAAAAALVIVGLDRRRTERIEERASNDRKREDRQTMVTHVAPAPLPAALPLVEREGLDADGYPRSYVDMAGLRSLLTHRRFADLNRHLETLQNEFEADPRKEYWPSDACWAFASAEPELTAPMNAWVTATPDSFAPYFARGCHYVAVGGARRGWRAARETDSESFRTMKVAFESALSDLDRALSRKPRLVAARRQQIEVHKMTSADALRDQAFKEAAAACPTCFLPRAAYLMSLEPRWGGSHSRMSAFTHGADKVDNPRFRMLEGFTALDRARVLEAEGRLKDALAEIERALAVGEHWDFLAMRARLLKRSGEQQRAFADLNRALELRPNSVDFRASRAEIERQLHHWEAAGRDLLEVLRVDPTDALARRLHKDVVQGLVYEGWNLHKNGTEPERALRLLEVAAELDPMNGDVQRRHHAVVVGAGDGGAPSDLPGLEAAARAAPDDFGAHQKLDYALAQKGKFDRVIQMWTEFLARHPEEGRANLERGGAYYRSGKRQEALADAQRACELGVSQGCVFAKRFAGGR